MKALYYTWVEYQGRHLKIGTDFNPTFSTDANTTSSPMKLAKELAHKSFKKIRTEVMGKTGTSEEKSKW